MNMVPKAGTRSRMRGRLAHAPTRGPRPLVPPLRFGHPMKGEYPLQDPLFEPYLFYFAEGIASDERTIS